MSSFGVSGCAPCQCETGMTPKVMSSFGFGKGKIWLDDLGCTGTESSLSRCSHRGWGTHNCGHGEDVVIICDEKSTAARLVSTTNTPGEGVLELYYEGQWGRVCSTGFGVEEATVACRMLGHNTIGASFTRHTKTSTPPVILDKVRCLGTELSFNECLHNPLVNVVCSTTTVAGIRCPSAYSQIRLSSTIRGRGRVEVLHNNVWGTLCRGSSFSTQEAKVVCKMANLPWTSASVTTSYGPGKGLIWLSNVDCTGTETSLDECSHSGWGTASCSHSSDVGVICSGATLQIHLEPRGSVLNVLLGQVISVVCVVDYSNSPVTSFRWTHNGSSYSGQTFSKTVTSKSDSGTLECSAGNVIASTQISVLYPPVVHLEPSNDTLDVTVGEDLRVECLVDDAKPSVNTFRWYHNGQTSTGSTFLKRNITRSDGGILTCTADNGHMMTPGRAVAHVNVRSTLQIHLEPRGRVLNVLLGQVISVVCVVDSFNSPVTSFRWTYKGRSYSGRTFSKTVTSKSDSGTLECSVGNVRASTQISVLYPPVVHLEPSNDTLDVTVGEDLRVECLVDDANPGVNTFRWYHNGQTSTGSIFLKRNITRSDGGKLTCTADNGHMMTPGRAVAHVNVQLQVSSAIGSDDTEYKNRPTAIVIGSVGMVTIIILILVIIHLRRSLHAAKLGRKPNERPNRTERANRARHQQNYETMETSGEGAEDTYCRFQMTPVRDNDPDHTKGNLGFAEEEEEDVQETCDNDPDHTKGNLGFAEEEEEDVQETCGPVEDAYYGNIQLELTENIRQQRGKKMEMKKAEGQEYGDEPIYQNTRGSNQLAK
ncbi:uncharacterized protein [Haliotis cracherodii]|uniref:uncharacterized protein isoform X2 n=1 Tax=Haliotis cracherodii TaxID=6455 RepID=UPI0039E7EC2D